MFGGYFYNGLIKKYVILFGSLFDDIYCNRVDATGTSQLTFKVPISYGPKERYMMRAIQNPDLLRPVSLVFPRMSFYITNIQRDNSRKLNTIDVIRSPNQYPQTNTYQYAPVPYNFTIRLSVIVRNTEEGLQIVEQILPYFTPEWTTTLDLFPDLEELKNIPVVINSVATSEHYEGQFESKQFTTWDLDFILKGYLYGPETRSKVIKSLDVNFFIPETNTVSEGVGTSIKQEHIYEQVGLDANGNPTHILANSIPVSQISSNSNWGVITEIVNDGDQGNLIPGD